MASSTASGERSILVSVAHPDDELGVGAMVARYVAKGARATLICSTDGDVGTVDEKYLRSYASIRELRLAELACATKQIGFTEVVTFGYRDSGMMGTPDNDDPASSWQAPLDEVSARVVEVMRRVRPQVVITFNTYGAYGHPDHIKIHQATLAAFELLQAEPVHPEKLYYLTFNPRVARAALRVMKLLRRDPRKMGRNADTDLQAAVEAITPITTRVRVRGRDRAKSHAARQCHASQITVSPVADLLGRLLGPLIFRQTTLSRVIPEPRPGEHIERDLFAGLEITEFGSAIH
jgi:LmbE family N-acetylglucosaminyl deacetylase